VSMACHGARRLYAMNENLAHIIAIELLCGAQGIEFRAPIKTSDCLMNVIAAVRRQVARLEDDRYMADDIAAAKAMVVNRSIIGAVPDDTMLPMLASHSQ
jgi:histidine ammonia-lyase